MAKKAAKKSSESIRCKVEVRHDFDVNEFKERTTELTTKMKNVEIREDNLKAQQATAKAEIKALKADVNDLANQLRNGFENREVDATVEFNRKKSTKTYFWFCPGKPDHKKQIKTDVMTQEDFQQLPLDDVPVDASKQPPLENAAAELQDSLQRRQVAEDGEPVRVRSEDEKE